MLNIDNLSIISLKTTNQNTDFSIHFYSVERTITNIVCTRCGVVYGCTYPYNIYVYIHAIHEIWITDPVGISDFLQSFHKRLKGLLAVLRKGRRDCINSIVFVGGMWGREGERKDSRLSKVEIKETQTYIHVILLTFYITFIFMVGTISTYKMWRL